MTVPTRTDHILLMVELERERQRRLLEEKKVPVDVASITEDDALKLSVLLEEVGEVARTINENQGLYDMLDELVQVAAVAVAWAESLAELQAFLDGS